MKHRGAVKACLVAAVFGSFASSASAFPGFFAYKGGKPINRSTHVVLMMKDSTTVVTVMPDYEGDLKADFAVYGNIPGGTGYGFSPGTFYRVDAASVINDTNGEPFSGAHSDIKKTPVTQLAAAAAAAHA